MINVPLYRPYFDSAELREVKKVLDSGWVTQGPKAGEFEDKVAISAGAKYAISVINCTAGLHLALLAIGVRPGDEVIVADYTYPATGHAVLQCGARPVFADIDLRTYNIDPGSIKSRITHKTKAILPVHTFGQSADMDPVMKIARRHGLGVIEDAACAFGAKYKNKRSGTIGDMGCFSFHARKGITTGEGGVVVTNNKKLAERARMLSIFGIEQTRGRRKDEKFSISRFTALGYNYKMSDITAAVGVAQIEKLNKIIRRKRGLAACWDKALEDCPLIEAPYKDTACEHIYQSYVCLIDSHINRNRAIEILRKKGVGVHIGTYALHRESVYSSEDKCPNSLEVFNRSLALPIYYALKKEDIFRASGIIKKTLEELR